MAYHLLKHWLDFLLALILLLACAPVALLIAVAILLDSRGPVIYRSQRIGKANEPFTMYKFRTMVVDTPEVATHLMNNSEAFTTPVGHVLRQFSLDEMPQLVNVLRGEMSLVGPRPALYTQDDLIDLRHRHGIDVLTPGLTGWAQVNGRDEASLASKVSLDRHYLANRSLLLDLKILLLTAQKVITREGVV